MRRIDSRVDAFLIGHPPPGTLLVYRLLRGRGPVVTDIRDSWFGGDRAIARALRTLARRELGLSNRVTALSRDVASWAELPPDDVTIVPIGVDDVPTPPHDSDDEGTTRCVFVGTINANFRLEDWVENWPRHDAAHLDIYGAGPNADRVEELSRAHPNVDFHGHLASDRVPEVLGRCDVGIAPTRPGFGTNISNKVAEYLAAGLLVLHSLEPEPSAVLAAHGLGESCSSDGSTLTDVLGRLATERDDLRSRREFRRRSSLDLLGWDRLATTMLGVMRDAIGTSP
jgi:glycosyltransferase involved in cell wall biosynthesis